MFNKLKRKFVILNVTTIGIILLASFTIIYSSSYSTTYTTIKSKLEIQTSANVATTTNKVTAGNMNNDISSFNILVTEAGEIFQVLSNYSYDEDYYAKVLALTYDDESSIKIDDEIWVYEIHNAARNMLDNETAYIYSFVNATDEINSLNYLLIALVLTFITMMVIVYYISRYFSSKYIAPIEENYIKQKRFVADASHELKTPIAVICANADALLLSKKDTIANQEKWINYIKDETSSMSKLVDDLLTLAKSEEVKLNITKVNVTKILTNSVVSFEAFAFEQNKKIITSIDEDIFIKTDEDKLKQLIKIFLDNALKYSTDCSVIRVCLKKEKNLIMTFENKSNIKHSELDKIFDRFYKCDEARTNKKSFGLGLSIANNIANDLNFSITPTKKNGNIIFTIKIK